MLTSFTHLKHAYYQQLDDLQIGSGGQKNALPLAPTCMGAGDDSEADQEGMEEVQLVAV